MRLFLLFFLLPLAAHADLYRWIDPATGTVKLSSLPPGDPTIEAEVVRFNSPVPPKPAPAGQSSLVADLQARWRALLTQITSLTPEDFQRGGDGIRQQVQAYEAVRAELDRQDPAGAARRNAEATAVAERFRQGLSAQFSPTPPR
jgi:hypothetical protein